MDEKTAHDSARREHPSQPTPRRVPRRPYTPPAIVGEHQLEASAQKSPLDRGVDPLNLPNEYGL